MSAHQTAGPIIGGGIGFIKGLVLTIPLTITLATISDTIILASIGAVTGWLVTVVLNYIKTNYLKIKPKK